ncbi:MAG: hypothetical protein ACPIOQ_09820 [Promethearchaeia archaeon]
MLRELWRGAGVSAEEPVAWEYALASRCPAVADGGGADLTPCPVIERPVRRGQTSVAFRERLLCFCGYLPTNPSRCCAVQGFRAPGCGACGHWSLVAAPSPRVSLALVP